MNHSARSRPATATSAVTNLLRERLDGWWVVGLLNLLLFAPYLFRGFLAQLFVLALCLALTAVMLLSRAVFALLAVPLVLINVFYLHVSYHWGFVSAGRVSLALESPPQERLEYLQTYLSLADAFIVVYAVACLLGIVHVSKRRMPSNALLRMLSLAPILLACMAVTSVPGAAKLPLVVIPVEIADAQVRAVRLTERDRIVGTLASGTSHCASELQTIVVVIGESASADHHALYGYEGSGPSPLAEFGLTRLDAISPANQTRLSLPLMLTRTSMENFDSFYRTPSLVTELGQCGFTTHWLSSHPRTGHHDDYIASIAAEAQEQIYLLDEQYDRDPFDEELLVRLETLKKKPGRHAFFVHLLGSHTAYEYRFPPSFAEEQPSVTANYDLSIRYTDLVLSRLLNAFDRSSLLWVYASDHGEVVSEGRHGHGYAPAYRNEYRIPLLVWSAVNSRTQILADYVGGRTVNADSFSDLVRFLAGMDPDPSRVSFSRQVLQASPSSRVTYDELQEFAHEGPRPGPAITPTRSSPAASR